MVQALKSRTQFLYEMAVSGEKCTDRSFDTALGWDLTRRQIHFLSQDTRFAIFLLLKSQAAMSREEIAEAMKFDPKKLYIHLYSMLRMKILVITPSNENPKFELDRGFLRSASELFDV